LSIPYFVLRISCLGKLMGQGLLHEE
jgi:hypothetical protein